MRFSELTRMSQFGVLIRNSLPFFSNSQIVPCITPAVIILFPRVLLALQISRSKQLRCGDQHRSPKPNNRSGKPAQADPPYRSDGPENGIPDGENRGGAYNKNDNVHGGPLLTS